MNVSLAGCSSVSEPALDPPAVSQNEPPDLSVVMPVYNEEQALPEVLDEALRTLVSAPFRTELVLVDDASTDGSLALLQTFQQQHPELTIRVLRHERNRGIAGAAPRSLPRPAADTCSSMAATDSARLLSVCE